MPRRRVIARERYASPRARLRQAIPAIIAKGVRARPRRNPGRARLTTASAGGGDTLQVSCTFPQGQSCASGAQLDALARSLCKRNKKRSGTDAKGRPLFKPVSVATVNRTLECFRAALYYACDHHEAFIRPGLKIKKLVEPKERTRDASMQDEVVIFAALREDFYDVARFALLTGIRFFGCVSLTWPNIDFESGTVTYRKKRKAGRAGDEWGHLPITGEVEAVLCRQVGRHRMQVWTYVSEGKKGGKGGSGSAGVFREGERYPITYWNLQTRWRRALAKAGVSDFRFHDLRHTAATRTLRATGNLKLVQEQLGHAQVTNYEQIRARHQ